MKVSELIKILEIELASGRDPEVSISGIGTEVHVWYDYFARLVIIDYEEMRVDD
jgi:hypothetical protein